MTITNIFHPDYQLEIADWDKYRLTYEAGQAFIDRYLRKLSKRETVEDYADRKCVTYCPAFAKAGVNEIKDSIYQRMSDIAREGGSDTYQLATQGLLNGVDLENSSMNYFMGCKVLPELLPMRRVGIYVDMPSDIGPSQADLEGVHPYLYHYRCEDIQCWVPDWTDKPGEFSSVLLKECIYKYDEETGFPEGQTYRWRRVWRDYTGIVWVCFYNEQNQMVDQFGNEITQPIPLKIPKVPFVMVEISESLMTDIADYQIALLNLASTDMSYVLKSNFPFYVEQDDPMSRSRHLRPAGTDKGGEAGDSTAAKTEEINVGTTRGRRYPKGMDRPGFIHPSPEPIKVSMEKQEQLKQEIRLLLKLTISNLKGPKMASAESKQEDSRSLESGLSYIGLTLENAERKVAEYWSMYEGVNKVATVHYPKTYDLKTEEQRREEAADLDKLLTRVPSMTFQKAVAKRMSKVMLENKVARDVIDMIDGEIDAAKTMIADPEVVRTDVEIGLVSLDLASQIRGYPKGEAEKAKQDHAERLARIQAAQTPIDSAARGVSDASADPASGKQEKKASRDTTKDPVPADKTRGKEK